MKNDITGVILAGGKGVRMGGRDKGLIALNGKPLVEHVLKVIRPQVVDVIISANRHLDEYSRFGHEVITDQFGEHWGPLAGIASGLRRAQTPYVLIAPCDTPSLPPDLVERLSVALMEQHKYLAVAHDGERLHNTVALIPGRLVDDVVEYLLRGGRKTQTWLESHAPAVVDFSDQPSAFVNVNSPEDCEKLQAANKP